MCVKKQIYGLAEGWKKSAKQSSCLTFYSWSKDLLLPRHCDMFQGVLRLACIARLGRRSTTFHISSLREQTRHDSYVCKRKIER